MANEESVCVEYIGGLMPSRHRCLVWLVLSPENKHINAKKIFEGLKDTLKDDVRNRFDSWLEGKKNDRWFHGWNEADYKNCFVFKYKKTGLHQRLYGFLCHPRLDEPKFLMCVVVSHTTKNEHEANQSEKKRMNELKDDKRVLQALKQPKKTCFEKE